MWTSGHGEGGGGEGVGVEKRWGDESEAVFETDLGGSSRGGGARGGTNVLWEGWGPWRGRVGVRLEVGGDWPGTYLGGQ